MMRSIILAVIAAVLLTTSTVFSFTLYAQEATVEPTTEPTVQPTTQPTLEPTVQPTTEPAPPPGFPDNPPATAFDGLNLLAIAIATLAGLAGARVTTAIRDLPFLKDEEKSKLNGLVADLIAFVTSTGTAYLVTWLTPLANTLDASGLWQVLLWAWPTAKAWYEIEKHRKSQVIEITKTV